MMGGGSGNVLEGVEGPGSEPRPRKSFIIEQTKCQRQFKALLHSARV